jgi:hypothetical protein
MNIEPSEPDLVVDPVTGEATIVIGGVEIPYGFTADDLENVGLIAPANPYQHLDDLFGGRA